MNRQESMQAVEKLLELTTEARRLAAKIATETESEYLLPNAHQWALDLTEVDNDVADMVR
jgi:hypothetical protein